MTTNNQLEFVKDLPNKKIKVTRNFDAPLELVWRAWTEAELLDQWWAPHPWKAETKFMNFKEGGYWLYSMAGPGNERHWARADFKAIEKNKSFHGVDYFCDENGNKNPEIGSWEWKNEFHATETGTKVVVNISFSSEADLKKIIETGFEAGFTAALGNLDQYLKEQFRLWTQSKTSPKARTCTYLNFPGNTEEAFNFYKSVFKSEFLGNGIQRFGDIPPQEGQPPIAESIKKMVLHVELPIVGGHVLMATDAPKEMGFTLTPGNNMHISVEPETRTETKRLFDALSAGGKVDMPLADMFFGSYFGSCTDKYGINWMVNCMEQSGK